MLASARYLSAIIASFITCIALTLPLQAARVDLQSPLAQTVVASAQNAIASLVSMRAQFVQINPDGQYHTGQIIIARPGRMRMDYDPPSSLLLLAKNNTLLIIDKKDQQTTSYPLSHTPAYFLLAEKLHYSFYNDEDPGDVQILAIDVEGGVAQIRLIIPSQPELGWADLLFVQNGDYLQLRQWRVRDAAGLDTRVTLNNIENNISIDQDWFYYSPQKN